MPIYAQNDHCNGRRHCQDRPTRILSGPVDSGAGRARFCRDEAEDVRIHSPFQTVTPRLFGILPYTPNSRRIPISADYLFSASAGSRRHRATNCILLQDSWFPIWLARTYLLIGHFLHIDLDEFGDTGT